MNEIIAVLKNCYKGTYKEFEDSVKDFVQSFMSYLYEVHFKKNIDSYKPLCIVKKNQSYLGETINIDQIIFNKKVIEELFNGNKDSIIVIFHELSHIEYNMAIINGESNENIINQIKEELLNKYQFEENCSILGNDPVSYYYLNYDYEASEVDADINAIHLTQEFLSKNNIEDKKFNEKLKKQYINLQIKKRMFLRYVGGNIIFNSYNLTLDEAFDCAIKNHPEWLEDFPQLKNEYENINGKVQKQKNLVFEKKAIL